MYYYEIITSGFDANLGWENAYFVSTNTPIHNNNNQSPIPDKVRILIEDREETIIEIRRLNLVKYLYLKYKPNNFVKYDTIRVCWEKEAL